MSKALTLAIADDDRNLSPEMAALRVKHRRFVKAKIEFGCNNTRAAEIAGFSGDAPTMRATAYRIAHRDDVQRALAAEGRRHLHSSSAIALATLTEFAGGEHIDPAVRLRASVAILERTGFAAQTQHSVLVEHRREMPEKLYQIKAYCEALGLDPREYLARSGFAVDAEFKEIIAEPKKIGAPVEEADDD